MVGTGTPSVVTAVIITVIVIVVTLLGSGLATLPRAATLAFLVSNGVWVVLVLPGLVLVVARVAVGGGRSLVVVVAVGDC